MQPYPPFCGDDLRPCTYEAARVAILPVPYEGTVSYGRGAAQGPRAILEASDQLEMYDEELDWCIDALGLYTLPPVDCAGGTPEQVMERIHAAALRPLRDGKFLVTLGGEHSISYGVFTAQQALRTQPFGLLQIDAHADLRASYHGTPHSHACIMARAHDLGLPFVQVGIRALSEQERAFLRASGREANVFWAHDIAARDESWMDEAVERLAPEVYVTLDVDGLDPTIMPATGTPVPGGLGWYPTLRLLRKVAQRRRIVGFDVTELAPMPGLHAPDFLAARLVYKLIGYALEGERR
jgi:N1-aminopropylagmatine ureohydrolase